MNTSIRLRTGDAISTAILTIAVVAIAVVVVRREVAYSRARDQAAPAKPAFVEGWDAAIPIGVRFGNPRARVTLVEFADLQCPACRALHPAIQASRAKFGNRLEYVFVHLPLPYHKQARSAAQGLECAQGSERGEAFIAAVFAQQDSLGRKSLAAFARDAGIADTVEFNKCVAHDGAAERIDAGLAAAQKLGVDATPTLFINGWKYRGAQSESALAAVVERMLAGNNPAEWQ